MPHSSRTLCAKGGIVFLLALLLTLALSAQNNTLTVPARITAGKGATLTINGSGTLYLSGPGFAAKHHVASGDFQLRPEDSRAAGHYLAILKSSAGTVTRSFDILPDSAANLIFQARPSRVPVARGKVISGSAYVFDQFNNLSTQPQSVNFRIEIDGSTVLNKSVPARDGIAYIQANSSPRAGTAQFIATAGSSSVRRVVQQVASDPCNLRMRAKITGDTVVVETDPVRDCSGNRVPDGTIVSFTAQERDGGRDQVDARVKKGVARAELPSFESGTISVAAGVVLGNTVTIGAAE